MKRLLAVLLSLTIAAATLAQDWPQWRGPSRDGSLSGFTPPKQWPENLTLRWSVEAGEGHSSPVVAGDRIFLLSRLHDQETVSCFDTAGRLLWRQSYPAPYTVNSAAVAHGKGPKSTPVVHDSKLCTLGISGILSCFSTSDGRLLWRQEFSRRFRNTSPLYGAAMSPLVYRGSLIAHVGGHGDGALAAFDLETGRQRWAWNGDGPGYASPVILELHGKMQLVTQTQSKIVGLDPSNGALLWEIPFTTPWLQNIVTPIGWRGVPIFSGLSNPTMAVRLEDRGGRWTAERVWEQRETPMYMSSPVIAASLLFGFTNRNRGQFFCLDPRTGEILWRGEPRTGDNAAVVAAGELLFLLTTEAELTIARARREGLAVIRKYSVADSPTWAHPVVLNAGVLIKDANRLRFWNW